jgi:hypothetical protein
MTAPLEPAAFGRRSRRRGVIEKILGMLAGCYLAVLTSSAPAQPADNIVVRHESYIEQLGQSAEVKIDDVQAVFRMVLESLPERVQVFPTEDYYYFKFVHRGVPYAGNIRLQHGLRDDGKLHFAYTVEPSLWRDQGRAYHKLLGPSEGVKVERIDQWTYGVSLGSKTVTFALNQMTGVAPPAGLLTADERYIGPVFDESGIRFFLVYNPKLKIFHYLLDQTAPVPEDLAKSPVSDRITLGIRTGFAFYRDRKDRQILIGVFEENARSNNYFDGPFDQLPDNFVEGETLLRAILEVEPRYKGKLDRFGSKFDGSERYMIAPYLHYKAERDLAMFERCARNRRIPSTSYYACFAVTEGQTPRPIAEEMAYAARNRR